MNNININLCDDNDNGLKLDYTDTLLALLGECNSVEEVGREEEEN